MLCEVGASSTATVVAVEDCKILRVVVGASGTASNVFTEACEARLETRLQTRLNKRLDLLSRQEARPERFKTRLNTRLNTRLDLAGQRRNVARVAAVAVVCHVCLLCRCGGPHAWARAAACARAQGVSGARERCTRAVRPACSACAGRARQARARGGVPLPARPPGSACFRAPCVWCVYGLCCQHQT